MPEFTVPIVDAFLSSHLPIGRFLETIEEATLRACITLCNGSKKDAAQMMGLKRTTFMMKLQKYGLLNKEALPFWESVMKKKVQKMASSSPLSISYQTTDAERIMMLEELIKELDETTMILCAAFENLNNAIEADDMGKVRQVATVLKRVSNG